MPGVRLPSPQTPAEWRRWAVSMVLSTVLFGGAILYRGRPWIRPFFIVVFVLGGTAAVVGTVLQVRRANSQRAAVPPSSHDRELRDLDQQIDKLMGSESELRALVARRDAGEISEEEFASRREEILGAQSTDGN